MKIEKIKKMANGKYQLQFSNQTKVLLYDAILLKYQVLLKKEITEELLEQLKKESLEIEIFQKAKMLIQKKYRSEREIRLFFVQHKVPISLQEEYIDTLKKEGYLNQSRFLESFVHDKLLLTLEGPNKIINDLLLEGYVKEEIEQQLRQVTEEEWKKRAQNYLQKQLSKTPKDASKKFKNKLSLALSRLGYSHEMIEELLETVTYDDSLLLEKDFHKLYQKYQKKYDSSTCARVVSQKLYQKGYNIDDITKIIQHYI